VIPIVFVKSKIGLLLCFFFKTIILGNIKRCAKNVKGKAIMLNPNGPPFVDITIKVI
jgi:hypothetical protein